MRSRTVPVERIRPLRKKGLRFTGGLDDFRGLAFLPRRSYHPKLLCAKSPCPRPQLQAIRGPYKTFLFRVLYYDFLIQVLEKVGYLGLRYTPHRLGECQAGFQV